MRVYEAAKPFKSVRDFDQKPVANTILAELIDGVRLIPSSGNLQPLEYAVITQKEMIDKVLG